MMRLNDRASIVGTRRTNDGYLAVNARVARAGNVQRYAGYEVGKPAMATVRVFRPQDEVFNKDTLASFAHRPVTLGHPSAAVTADTWASVAKGWSDGEVARDGEFVRLSMLLADAGMIRAIEGGTREISMGYDCELDWTPGTSPSGEIYDARQTRIRGNHIAIVDNARGGPELKIGDALVTSDEERAQARKHAAYDHMCHQQAEAWKAAQPVNDNLPVQMSPQFARDGRPMSSLTDQQRAYEEMCIRDASAWRR